jgi:uncharacterized protein (DUF362 family)/Pyruvate/2-oxoacid:ferredoxin oxidoreductase delta subunit
MERSMPIPPNQPEPVLIRKGRYDPETLEATVHEMLTGVGGDRIEPGMQVLIKPNLLMPASPDSAILTHPRVVRSAATYALGKGAKVTLSDSPAVGSFERILRKGGFREALADLDVTWREFRSTVSVDIGRPFGRIDIARDALSADLVINLAKLKTHAQMLLTLGVKNMFGCIVGMEKPRWHLRSGVDRDRFAELLVRVYRAVNPAITLVDGILGLEGQGPGRSGTPIEIGALIAGKSAPAVDAAICRMVIGIPPDELATHRAANRLGLVNDAIEIGGDQPEVCPLRLPEMARLTPGSAPIQRFMRRHLIQRPVPDEDICRLCGDCSRFCPAEAIAQETGHLAFDYDRCIRCYCCIEICPHGALRAADPAMGKALRHLRKWVRPKA